ncbi:MAG: PilC/PilY family type IV pilus protein [Myxococcota bacterium]|nr:PilC/PilY family type IV pilus protein [Myxococcota bacterium]
MKTQNKNIRTFRELIIVTCFAGFGSSIAQAQVPYDPTVAVRPAPNIMVVMDATRTTLINGETCRGLCHTRNGHSDGHDDAHIYRRGETRLQLARQVLTGGWGWNSNGRVANSDARVSTDGIMDVYRGYRWGLTWYDGTGPRLAIDPTSDNERAQKTMIDFGMGCFEILPGNSNTCYYGLNSWMPQRGSTSASNAESRQARALQYVHDYWKPGISPPQTSPQLISSQRQYGAPNRYIPGGFPPNDNQVIDQDQTNVLINAPNGTTGGGCRRNFTIMLQDGHGGDNGWNGLSNGASAGQIFNMRSQEGNLDLSCVVFDSNGNPGPPQGNDPTCTQGQQFANQVFAIHFGVSEKDDADRVADWGFDGQQGEGGFGNDGITEAFEGAPGGAISDLSVLKAAFTQVMELLSPGDYIGATPSISRFGEHIVYSSFTIPNCTGVPFGLCNFGRPGDVSWIKLDDNGESTPLPGEQGAHRETVSMGQVLEQLHNFNRRMLTSYPQGVGASSSNAPPGEFNCGDFAGHSGDRCTGNDASMIPIDTPFQHGIGANRLTQDITGSSPGNLRLFRQLNLKYNDIAYLTGNPVAKLESGPFRGDWDCDSDAAPNSPSGCCTDANNDGAPDTTNSAGNTDVNDSQNPRNQACLDRHFKIADIANSRPVIVGAPTGLAEDLKRWRHFLEMNIPRSSGNVSASISNAANDQTVGTRDRVVYVGGNDGFLHAFLVGETTGQYDTENKVAIEYDKIASDCTGADRERCHGQELWAYSPGMLQESWGYLKAGHFYMIDGSPVVSDVLFTKGNISPATNAASICNRHDTNNCNDWEYRTVLLQCLGIGGPGCFAMDVTNPYNPQLLWEREFTRQTNTTGNSASAPTARVTTTSRPQIHRVKRVVNGVAMPYYVGVMGGGMQEALIGGAAGNRAGSLLVVGLEDGAYWHSPASELADADFAGTPTCIDASGDSYVDTCYILTTEADIYKVRFTNSDPSQGMTVRKFFDGRRAVTQVHQDTANILSYTKLVATYDPAGRLTLFFATGNYEDVQDVNEQNYVFKVIDTAPMVMDGSDVDDPRNLARIEDACGSNIPGSPFVNEGARGGYGVMKLPQGEKVIFDPVLGGGSFLFTSYAPDSNTCGVGEGRIYGIYFDDCTQGLNTDNSDNLNAFVIRPGANVNTPNGQLTGIAHDAESGVIHAGFNNPVDNASGGLVAATTQKKTREKEEIPVLKLWWRQINP